MELKNSKIDLSDYTEDEKAQWQKEKFAQGYAWGISGKKPSYLNGKYFYCFSNGTMLHGNVSKEFEDHPHPLETWSPLLKADFTNAKVGDRVKCLVFGEGVIFRITEKEEEFPIYVKFDNGYTKTYAKDGCASLNANPTLFYHFEGQFPTREACTRPAPDVFELHGVTREQLKEMAKAVEVVKGWKPKYLTWSQSGKAIIWDTKPSIICGGWTNGSACRVDALKKQGPYEHCQTPIELEGL